MGAEEGMYLRESALGYFFIYTVEGFCPYKKMDTEDGFYKYVFYVCEKRVYSSVMLFLLILLRIQIIDLLKTFLSV